MEGEPKYTYDKKLKCYICLTCGTETVIEDGTMVCQCNEDDFDLWPDVKERVMYD